MPFRSCSPFYVRIQQQQQHGKKFLVRTREIEREREKEGSRKKGDDEFTHKIQFPHSIRICPLSKYHYWGAAKTALAQRTAVVVSCPAAVGASLVVPMLDSPHLEDTRRPCSKSPARELSFVLFFSKTNKQSIQMATTHNWDSSKAPQHKAMKLLLLLLLLRNLHSRNKSKTPKHTHKRSVRAQPSYGSPVLLVLCIPSVEFTMCAMGLKFAESVVVVGIGRRCVGIRGRQLKTERIQFRRIYVSRTIRSSYMTCPTNQP